MSKLTFPVYIACVLVFITVFKSCHHGVLSDLHKRDAVSRAEQSESWRSETGPFELGRFEAWKAQATSEWNGVSVTPEELKELERLDVEERVLASNAGEVSGISIGGVPVDSGPEFETIAEKRLRILALDKYEFFIDKQTTLATRQFKVSEELQRLRSQLEAYVAYMERGENLATLKEVARKCPQVVKAILQDAQYAVDFGISVDLANAQYSHIAATVLAEVLMTYRQSGQIPDHSKIDQFEESLEKSASELSNHSNRLSANVSQMTTWKGGECPVLSKNEAENDDPEIKRELKLFDLTEPAIRL